MPLARTLLSAVMMSHMQMLKVSLRLVVSQLVEPEEESSTAFLILASPHFTLAQFMLENLNVLLQSLLDLFSNSKPK